MSDVALGRHSICHCHDQAQYLPQDVEQRNRHMPCEAEEVHRIYERRKVRRCALLRVDIITCLHGLETIG